MKSQFQCLFWKEVRRHIIEMFHSFLIPEIKQMLLGKQQTLRHLPAWPGYSTVPQTMALITANSVTKKSGSFYALYTSYLL